LDNPAVEIGGFPVAKSTVKTWELAGKLPRGAADSDHRKGDNRRAVMRQP
jgi:hypothetical protein